MSATWKKVLGNFDQWGWLGKVPARLHARLPGGRGWDWCLEIALGRSMENLFRVFLLEKSSSNHTKEHHHVEATVVSMGQLKKSAVNTRAEL